MHIRALQLLRKHASICKSYRDDSNMLLSHLIARHSHFKVHADVLNERGVLQAVAALCVWVHALQHAGGPGKLLPCVEW